MYSRALLSDTQTGAAVLPGRMQALLSGLEFDFIVVVYYLGCGFLSSSALLLAYHVSKSPSKSFHPRFLIKTINTAAP